MPQLLSKQSEVKVMEISKSQLWRVQILSHAIQWSPRLSCLGLHLKLDITLLGLSIKPCGNTKQYITSVRRACATDLIRNSFSPFERNLADQVFIRVFSWSWTKEKLFSLSHKYVQGVLNTSSFHLHLIFPKRAWFPFGNFGPPSSQRILMIWRGLVVVWMLSHMF